MKDIQIENIGLTADNCALRVQLASAQEALAKAQARITELQRFTDNQMAHILKGIAQQFRDRDALQAAVRAENSLYYMRLLGYLAPQRAEKVKLT